MARIAIMASGNGSNFEALADHFKDNNTDDNIVVLIYDRKNAFVKERAQKYNIPVLYVNYVASGKEGAEDKIREILTQYTVDIVFLAGFMRILSDRFLEKITIPLINIHPSLLPKYKGTHAIERAFTGKEKETGITIHYVIPELDSGEIILQKKLSCRKNETLDELEERIHQLEHKWYPVVAENLCKKINEKR